MSYEHLLNLDYSELLKLTTHERIKAILALRNKVLQGGELTEEEVALSTRLLRAERGKSRPKEDKEPSLDDLGL